VADVEGRSGWLETGIYAASRFGEDFAKRNFYTLGILWVEII
jgi:hypothetical protein